MNLPNIPDKTELQTNPKGTELKPKDTSLPNEFSGNSAHRVLLKLNSLHAHVFFTNKS